MNIKVFWLILITIILYISNVKSIKFAENGEWKKGWICSVISVILFVIILVIEVIGDM